MNRENQRIFHYISSLDLRILAFFLSDAPRVDLALGKSISPGSIYEGGDVYFDCLVVASPKPTKILWFQDVSKLKCHFMQEQHLCLLR